MEKKFYQGLLSALFVAAGVTGCDKSENNSVSNPEGKEVFVRMELSGNTRGLTDPIGDGQELTLSKVKIVFLTTNGTV